MPTPSLQPVAVQHPGLVITSRDGRIAELNAVATELLNITMLGCERRPRVLPLFFDSSRAAVFEAQWRASPQASAAIHGMLRPRERPRRPVSLTVRELSDGYLEWTIVPAEIP